MTTTTHDDRWLLPRRQTEFPTRDLLPEETLHGRRESTFLALAAIVLASAAALVVLGASRVVDLSALLARVAPDLDLPVAMLAPLGVATFAASLVATSLVCAVFGRRRAGVLVAVASVVGFALAGLMRVADLIDGGEAFAMSLALAAAFVVAHASHVLVFDRVRKRGVFLPTIAAGVVANVLGWSAFAGVLRVLAASTQDTAIALAVGSAQVSLAALIVLAVPAALAARGLAVALRVGHDLFRDTPLAEPTWTRPAFAEGSVARRLPQALIVDDDEPADSRPRARRASLNPYSSAELRFFDEGDALPD